RLAAQPHALPAGVRPQPTTVSPITAGWQLEGNAPLAYDTHIVDGGESPRPRNSTDPAGPRRPRDRMKRRAFLNALRPRWSHPTTDHSMPWLSDAALTRGLTVISIS